MPFDSIICRKTLDESRGNLWFCTCPRCRVERMDEDVGSTIYDIKGRSQISEAQSAHDLQALEEKERYTSS